MKRYVIRNNPRARRLWLTVRSTGEIVLTLPKYATKRHADEFVKEHEGWLKRKLRYFAKARIVPPIRGGKRHYEEHREGARKLVRSLVEQHAGNGRFEWKSIAVRRQKTRWGSCSAKGALSFNYMILFLPAELQEYIVVHELCHLLEFNHSKRFWGLVRGILPDCDRLRTELRRYALR